MTFFFCSVRWIFYMRMSLSVWQHIMIMAHHMCQPKQSTHTHVRKWEQRLTEWVRAYSLKDLYKAIYWFNRCERERERGIDLIWKGLAFWPSCMAYNAHISWPMFLPTTSTNVYAYLKSSDLITSFPLLSLLLLLLFFATAATFYRSSFLVSFSSKKKNQNVMKQNGTNFIDNHIHHFFFPLFKT